jgi:hypothetical protein
MRWWTIPILGAVAFSLTDASTANARPRFGPGAVLGAIAAPLGALLGARPSLGHQRRSTAPGRSRAGEPARQPEAVHPEEPARIGEAERGEPAPARGIRSGWVGPVFWPHASDDMFAYALLPNGSGDRFWSYGHADLQGVFADAGPLRTVRARGPAADRSLPATSEPKPSFVEFCGGVVAPSGVDGVVEHLEQSVQPSAAQREMLAGLRTALQQASDRIKAACRATMPATPLERLDTMQDRIWAMRDAVLTIRMPLERFYDSLDEMQKARLNGIDAGQGRIAGQANYLRERAVAQMCREQASAFSDTRAIERALRPTDEQRASLMELQMRLAGLSQLIMSSCPAQPPETPLGRLAAASDRLTVMLFAVMTIGPSLQSFYNSLSDTQKTELGKVISQQLRPGQGT